MHFDSKKNILKHYDFDGEKFTNKKSGRIVKTLTLKSDNVFKYIDVKRASWICNVGKIPKNHVIRHKSQNESINISNLFLVDKSTLAQDNQRKLNENNKTGVRGVYFDNNRQCYIAEIVPSKGVHSIKLGGYTSIKEAAAARHTAELRYWG